MWLSLAFGHISEWSIESDRDKLAVTKEEPTTQKNHTFKLWFRNNMPFQASHCPGVRNTNTRAKWSLWCGCRGNVLNVLLWGPGPRGYGDTATSFSQFCVNKTYRETLAFPKGATSRKREQPKPKQSKIIMGFWDTFLLSVKWESVTKDIWHPPSWKRCLLLVVHFFWKSFSWDIYPFKNYRRPLKFLTKYSLWKIASLTQN